MNVLITCGGGFQGLTLVKSLKKIPNLSVFLCDINQENISKYFADYFIISEPIVQEEKYKDFLFKVCKEKSIDFVFPATVFDLKILSSIKIEFLEKLNCTISTCDAQFIEIFLNKKKTHLFLEENKLPILESLNPNETNHFPIIGKPIDGFGGKGILRIQSAEEIHSKIKIDDYLWNPLIEDFEEYSIDFSVNSKGVVSQQVLRKRDFVTGGFACVISYPMLNDYIIQSNLKKLKLAFTNRKLEGLFNVQFILSKNELYFIDINPRIGTSAISSSFNNYSLFKHSLGILHNSGEQIISSKSIRFLEEKHIPMVDLAGIKGVVFDLDDTLISNKRFILDRCNLLFDIIDIESIEKLDYQMFVIGLLNEGKAPILIDALSEYLQLDKNYLLENYRNCWPNELKYYNDVLSTLKQLSDLGLDIFILTDNPKKTQQKKIDVFRWRKFIKKVYFTDEMNSSKPNKECFQIIARENGYSLDSLIMVGDNYYRDIQGAINAGYRYGFKIKRKDGMVGNVFFDEVEKEKGVRKDFEIDSLHDLIEIF